MDATDAAQELLSRRMVEPPKNVNPYELLHVPVDATDAPQLPLASQTAPHLYGPVWGFIWAIEERSLGHSGAFFGPKKDCVCERRRKNVDVYELFDLC